MNFTKFLAVFSLVALVAACGKSDTQQQADDQNQPADDIRTVDIIGIDAMKYAVENDAEGITVGDTTGKNNDLLLLETIEATPGEEIRVKLTTKSDLPATAMAHNWVLLTLDADASEFAKAAVKARDNDYIPSDMTDQILEQTEMVGGEDGPTEVVFNAPTEPGEYTFLCTFPGHYAAGMYGTLVVQEETTGAEAE